MSYGLARQRPGATETSSRRAVILSSRGVLRNLPPGRNLKSDIRRDFPRGHRNLLRRCRSPQSEFRTSWPPLTREQIEHTPSAISGGPAVGGVGGGAAGPALA